MKKDSMTLNQKASLRLSLLKQITHPIVLETHAGTGQVWKRVYSEILSGVAFDAKAAKAAKRAASRRAAGTRSKSSPAGRRPAAKKRGSKTAKPASPVAAPVASESPSVPPAGV